MSVVNVIDMTFVFDRGVAAVRGVPVTVVGMDFESLIRSGFSCVVWLIPLKDATSLDQLHCTNSLRIDNLAIEEIGKGQANQKAGAWGGEWRNLFHGSGLRFGMA